MTALNVAAPLIQGRAQRKAAEINASLMERDAGIADDNRKVVVRQHQVAAEDRRRSSRRTMSTLRTAYGSSGFTMEGSPMDVLEDTAQEQELDARRIENRARIANREGAFQVLNLKEQAKITRRAGRNAQVAGFIGAGQQVVAEAEKFAKAFAGG